MSDLPEPPEGYQLNTEAIKANAEKWAKKQKDKPASEDSRLITPAELLELSKDNEKFNKAVRKDASALFVRKHAEEVVRAAMNPAGAITLTTEAEIAARPAPEYWVPDLIPQDTVGVLAGMGGIGKTFLTIHMSRCIASGMPFFGRPVKQGKVLYVAGEGAAAFGKRVRAWDTFHHQYPVPEGSINYIESGVNFADPDSVANFEEVVKQLQPEVIILDTWSVLSGVSDENDNAGTARVMRDCKRIRSHVPGSAIVWIHHVNKSAGKVRGAGALRDNSDFVVMAKPHGDGFYLSTEVKEDGKAKDAAPVHWDGFVLDSHLDSAVLTRRAVKTLHPEFLALREVFEDDGPHTKAEARIAAGFEKASGSDNQYQRWSRKFNKYVDSGVLLPVDGEKDTYLLATIARAPEPPFELPVWM